MSLITQIKSLLFSFVFGILLSILITLFDKIIYHKKMLFQILNTFLISIFSCLIYFIFIKKINYGVIHFYFILILLIGLFLDVYILKIGVKLKQIFIKIKTKIILKKITWHYLHQNQ